MIVAGERSLRETTEIADKRIKRVLETVDGVGEVSLTGARLRLRPILMTAFAFILGCVPLWTASGAGAIARQTLGTCVIGGMLAATILAIFFIPVSFDVVEKFGMKLSGKKHEPHGGAAGATATGVGHD